tara:strand:+ start:358 stop:537 length:180 start_codon:yes stop_codon:yes gene_type:complete
MIIHFSYIKLITQLNIYKIREEIKNNSIKCSKSYIYQQKKAFLVKNPGKTAFTYQCKNR